MRIDVDSGRCVGAGQCVLAAPALFDQDEAAMVVLLNGEPTGDEVDAAQEAENVCPSGAITLTT
ncbi:Ferredoxin [Actinokineospora spheciospongiae]|uniref:Ferredoxin n=1 Tax=Actinokineospora spheciospongiae TaxID=909613 RepID=W7IZ85_9PSEU|nr:ferredoxin [Actinokineospora spheciospongiae]EWC59364.1 Ferredoxin [Actinokineospora spheciospongiae]PWW63423.1 ferredoxin [Actinokineospora spheciospongiae]